MLDTSRIGYGKLLEALYVWDIWHAEVSCSHYNRIKFICPPVVIIAIYLLLSQGQGPLVGARIFHSFFDSSVEFYKIPVSFAIEQLFYVLTDNRVMSKW